MTVTTTSTIKSRMLREDDVDDDDDDDEDRGRVPTVTKTRVDVPERNNNNNNNCSKSHEHDDEDDDEWDEEEEEEEEEEDVDDDVEYGEEEEDRKRNKDKNHPVGLLSSVPQLLSCVPRHFCQSISRQTMLGGILQDTPSWLLGLPLAWHHPQQQQQSTPTATPTLPAPPSAPPPPPQRTQIGAPGIPLSSPDLQNHLLHHRLHKDPDDLFSASGHTLHQHQQNHHHQAAPVSRTYQYRKVMKPLLERKRRARINRCLDELKELMVTALQAEGENVAKLEKADVLELTVSHLRKLRRQQQTHHSNQNPHQQQQQQQSGTNTAGQLLTNGGKSDDDEEERFRAGFARCASEVSSFLARHWCPPGGAEAAPALSSRLLGHLAHCVRSLHSVACGSGGNPTGSGVMAPAVSWFPSSEAVAAAAAAAAAQDTPLCLAPNSRSMWRPW